jgi:hypothetical protein
MAKRLKWKDHEKMTRSRVMATKATITTTQDEKTTKRPRKPQKDHEE